MKHRVVSTLFNRVMLSCAAIALWTVPVQAQYTPVWYDGYATATVGNDINFQIGAPRQGGASVPTSYVANTPNEAVDWEQQLIGPGATSDRLMLASASPTPTLVSPLFNFVGSSPSGVIGKRITFDLDAGAVVMGSPSYIQAGITLGGSSTLLAAQSAPSNFSIRFLEDNFSGNGNFIQLFDGSSIVGNLIPNPAGAGWMSVDIQINDPIDLNPWDGVGSTQIDLYVNTVPVASYTKGGGGYTDNYLTLEGSANFVGMNLAIHHFDELTVWASPVPEPSALAFAVMGVAGFIAARRRK